MLPITYKEDEDFDFNDPSIYSVFDKETQTESKCRLQVLRHAANVEPDNEETGNSSKMLEQFQIFSDQRIRDTTDLIVVLEKNNKPEILSEKSSQGTSLTGKFDRKSSHEPVFKGIPRWRVDDSSVIEFTKRGYVYIPCFDTSSDKEKLWDKPGPSAPNQHTLITPERDGNMLSYDKSKLIPDLPIDSDFIGTTSKQKKNIDADWNVAIRNGNFVYDLINHIPFDENNDVEIRTGNFVYDLTEHTQFNEYNHNDQDSAKADIDQNPIDIISLCQTKSKEQELSQVIFTHSSKSIFNKNSHAELLKSVMNDTQVLTNQNTPISDTISDKMSEKQGTCEAKITELCEKEINPELEEPIEPINGTSYTKIPELNPTHDPRRIVVVCENVNEKISEKQSTCSSNMVSYSETHSSKQELNNKKSTEMINCEQVITSNNEMIPNNEFLSEDYVFSSGNGSSNQTSKHEDEIANKNFEEAKTIFSKSSDPDKLVLASSAVDNRVTKVDDKNNLNIEDDNTNQKYGQDNNSNIKLALAKLVQGAGLAAGCLSKHINLDRINYFSASRTDKREELNSPTDNRIVRAVQRDSRLVLAPCHPLETPTARSLFTTFKSTIFSFFGEKEKFAEPDTSSSTPSIASSVLSIEADDEADPLVAMVKSPRSPHKSAILEGPQKFDNFDINLSIPMDPPSKNKNNFCHRILSK